jgi:4-hydroxy-tetrahydrodipicolinate reductase
MSSAPPLEVVVIGAGPIGLSITSAALSRASLRVAGVVDIDPNKLGKDVGKLLGVGPFGVDVSDRVPASARAAILCTTSSLEKLEPSVLDLVRRGIHVVSTCEELVWPWRKQPERAQRIDQAAQKGNAVVLGTGVNPGFVMDLLPLALTGVCHDVKNVRIERVQDAAKRRRAFQDKVGVGMEPAAFAEGMATRALGHVGLSESCEMIAARLGVQLDDVVEEMRAIVADADLSAEGRTIKKGQVAGVEQVVRGISELEARVELVFRAAFAQQDARDRIVLDARPPIDVTIEGGIPGDVATSAIVLNALEALSSARPGLRTMADYPLVVSRIRRE